jgi:hypothetical protein
LKRLPVFWERRSTGSFTGKLGEWIELAEPSGEAEASGIPALRIRKADRRPPRGGGVWIKSNPDQEMPKEAKATIIEYGTYGNLQETGISEEDGARSHMIIDQKHLVTTDRIPRTDGTAFGYRFLPEGYFAENRITFVTRCPDILGIDGTREVRFERTIQETIVNSIIGWLVEPEDSPGTYVFQIWADDLLLCEKSFGKWPTQSPRRSQRLAEGRVRSVTGRGGGGRERGRRNRRRPPGRGPIRRRRRGPF